jgi:hypothetical protein
MPTLAPSALRAFLSGGISPLLTFRAKNARELRKLQATVPELYTRTFCFGGTDGFRLRLIRDLELFVQAGLTARMRWDVDIIPSANVSSG